MARDAATERVRCELHRAIDCMRHDLTRVEILTAALAAFARPIPNYEPAFRHKHKITLGAQELGGQPHDR